MTTGERPELRMGLETDFLVPFEQHLEVQARLRSEVEGRMLDLHDGVESGINEALAMTLARIGSSKRL
jgi:hypothetical protein